VFASLAIIRASVERRAKLGETIQNVAKERNADLREENIYELLIFVPIGLCLSTSLGWIETLGY
jgi:hypothetical protein